MRVTARTPAERPGMSVTPLRHKEAEEAPHQLGLPLARREGGDWEVEARRQQAPDGGCWAAGPSAIPPRSEVMWRRTEGTSRLTCRALPAPWGQYEPHSALFPLAHAPISLPCDHLPAPNDSDVSRVVFFLPLSPQTQTKTITPSQDRGHAGSVGGGWVALGFPAGLLAKVSR